MTAVEYVMWMNGAAGLCGDTPPTPEQWAVMQEKLGEAVARLVADRLLEKATDLQKEQDLAAEREKQLFEYHTKMRLGMGTFTCGSATEGRIKY